MSRKLKNLSVSFILIVSIILIIGTLYLGQSHTNQIGTPPSMNQSGNTLSMPNKQNGTSNSQTPPSFPNGNTQKLVRTSPNYVLIGLLVLESLIVSSCVIYLVISRGSKYSLNEIKQSKKKLIVSILVLLILTETLTYGETFFIKKQNQPNISNMSGDNSSSVKATGKQTVTTDTTISSNVSTSKQDQSAILVKNGAHATLNYVTLTKSGGVSNVESSEFYGVNSGLLVQKNSSATINNATITTSAKGSNAIFATGTNSKITIKNSSITTKGSSNSRGLDATYGGTIVGDNLTISTQGTSSASLATDRGEGNITVSNSKLSTNGQGSPLIYSTGNIKLSNSTGEANHAQIVVVEGKNSATVTNATLSSSGQGNRNNVDNAGIMLYQSMSGDANEGIATFTSNHSILSIQSSSKYYSTAPMFFITNTKAVINLNNTKLNFGSGELLHIAATSEWGKSGQNGGDVTFNANNQTLNGDIYVDKLSTLSLNLTKTNFKGGINTKNNAKSISLTLSKDSILSLTQDTYLTSLNDKDTSLSNIQTNGYKLYVNGKQVK